MPDDGVFLRVAGVVMPVENATGFRSQKVKGAGITRSAAGRAQDRRYAGKRVARVSTIAKSLEEGEAFANLLEGYGHACRYDDGDLATSTSSYPTLTTPYLDPVGGRFGTGALVIPSGGEVTYLIDIEEEFTFFAVLWDVDAELWRTHVIRSDGLRLLDGLEPEEALGYVPFDLTTIVVAGDGVANQGVLLLGQKIDGTAGDVIVDEWCLWPWLMPESMIMDVLDNVAEDKVSPFPRLHVSGRILDGVVGAVCEGAVGDAEYAQRGGQPEGWENNALRTPGQLVEVQRLDSVDDTPLATVYCPLSSTTRSGADTVDVAGARTGTATGSFTNAEGVEGDDDSAILCAAAAGDRINFGDDGAFEGHAGATGKMSFACWVRPTGGLATGTIAGKWRESTNEREWRFDLVSGQPRVRVSNGAGTNLLSFLGDVVLGAGAWCFLAFTFNLDSTNRAKADYVRMWGAGGLRIPQTLTETGTFASVTAGTAQLHLFNTHDPTTNQLAARMQHAALWSGVELTAKEIRTVYRATNLGRRLRRV